MVNNAAEFVGRMTVLATLSGIMARLNGGSFANAAWSTVFKQLFNVGGWKRRIMSYSLFLSVFVSFSRSLQDRIPA